MIPSGRVRSFVFIVSLSPGNIDFSGSRLSINDEIRMIGNSFYNIRNRLTDRTGGACIIVHVTNMLDTDIGIPGDCLHIVWIVGALASRVRRLRDLTRRLLCLNISNTPVCASRFHRLGGRILRRSSTLCPRHNTAPRRRTGVYLTLLVNCGTAVCGRNSGRRGGRIILGHY